MPESFPPEGFDPLVAMRYRLERANEQILASSRDLTDDQLRSSRGLTVPSIAFHLWHVGRWTDRVQSLIAKSVEPAKEIADDGEVWITEGLAGKWNLPREHLGEADSGMGMDDKVAADLELPLADVRDYTERMMVLLQKRLEGMRLSDLGNRTVDLYGRESSIGTALLSHLTHVDRHLGMIEALRGVAGLRGTATV
jgi:DinB family protein